MNPMKIPGAFASCVLALLVAGMSGSLPSARAAGAAPLPTVPPEPEIPKSVFTVSGEKLKDPFFPNSTRVKVVPTAAPLVSSSTFELKAITGPPGARLAIINNRTVANGEDAEVTTPLGRLKIHCLEIRESSVTIRSPLSPEPIELRFRKGM
jgi:hypothetical protein